MQVFSAFGLVHKITTFEKTAGFQAKLVVSFSFLCYLFLFLYTSFSKYHCSHCCWWFFFFQVWMLFDTSYLNVTLHCSLFPLCRPWFNFLIQKLHILQRMLLMEEIFQGDYGIVWVQTLSDIFCVNHLYAGISWRCQISLRIVFFGPPLYTNAISDQPERPHHCYCPILWFSFIWCTASHLVNL